MMKQIAEEKEERLTKLAYDAKDYKYAKNYCELYLQLLCEDGSTVDDVSGFYIRDLRKEIDKLPKDKRNAIIKYFALDGGVNHFLKVLRTRDIAFQNMFMTATDASEYLQSFASAYRYNKTMKLAIDKVATKVYDPKGEYTNVQKAKYASLYYWYVKDFQYMPYDSYLKGRRPLIKSEKMQESRTIFTADIIADKEFQKYFDTIPDNDILIPMLEKFLLMVDEDDEIKIRNDCQLLVDKYNHTFLGDIRRIKEKFFEFGEWENGDFCRISEFQKLSVEKVMELCENYQKYSESFEWECKDKTTKKVLFMNQGYSNIEIMLFSGKKTYFSDPNEMLQFVEMLDYLYDNIPTMKFHGKPISSYQLFYDLV